jgi:hypothetical protein
MDAFQRETGLSRGAAFVVRTPMPCPIIFSPTGYDKASSNESAEKAVSKPWLDSPRAYVEG